MATFLEVIATAENQEFQSRVKAATVKSAIAIVGEAIGSMTEAQTLKRQNTATAVLQNAQNWLNWALAVASNPAISLGSTDGDIEFTVNSIWDKMAGVTSIDMIVV